MHRNKTGLPWSDYLNAKTSQRKRPLPKTHGLQCADCRRIHPYNGSDKLGLDYMHRDNQLIILWLCPYTNNVLGEASYVKK
jgi:hypothetical protein